MTTSDELTNIFESLNPDDFVHEGSSALGVSLPLPQMDDFEDFITFQMGMLRFAFASCDGEINSMISLGMEDRILTYQAYDRETLSHFIDRIHDEATRLNAKWSFFYKRTMITHMSNVERSPNVDVDVIKDDEKSWEAVYWHATSNENGSLERQHGYAQINGDRLGLIFKAPTQVNEILDRIL